MTDDHAPPASDEETDSGSNADGAGGSPGGGPKRVVSETSVDDILASIDSGPDEEDDRAETIEDADGTVEADDVEDASAEDGNPGASGDDTIEATDEDDGSDTENGDETGVTATFDETDLDGDRSADQPAANRVDPTAELGDGDLADRIESGAVTGADVRAAEAGEGRDPTPEVDEIDLSIDDLETDTPPGDEADPSETVPGSDGDDEEGSGSVGLVGRLKRLFSR